MKPFRHTYEIDQEELEKALTKLEALRGDGDINDGTDDLPEALPLDGTTVTFFGGEVGDAGTASQKLMQANACASSIPQRQPRRSENGHDTQARR